MKIMGLDVGDKTIGIAISDALLITAQGLKTLMRVGIKKDTNDLLNIIKENNIDEIVIGIPKNLNGTDSPQTEKVYLFKEKLQNKLKSNSMQDIRLIDWDERYTTSIAEDVLIQANMDRHQRKEVIDKMAAVIILQSYLDYLKNVN
ncbi:MAG: Holliday junction resolvase RuvX [Peptostreptococcales bacterium]